MIPPDVLDQFKEMYHRCLGNNSNPNENIQRVNENDIGDNLQFPDWQCVESLCEDFGVYIDENCSIHEEFIGHTFDLDREGFIQIVKMIPYMMIETIHACPCCELYNNCYFNHLDVPVPIDYFICHHGTFFFVNTTELINHFSVQLHPKINDDIKRYHQFFISSYHFISIVQ